MTTKKLKSIKGRTIRLTKLDECGAVVEGECSYIVSDGFVSVTIAQEIEAGQEFTTKNAWGDFCISEKDAPRVKWVNVTINFCEVDPEILDLIGGANLITDSGDNIGATFGQDVNVNSFALEVWTKKAGVDACAGGTIEWGYFVIPFIRNGIIDGNVVIENGPLTFAMKGEGNAVPSTWGEGPFGDNPLKDSFPEGDLWGMVVTDVQPPTPTTGCSALGPATGATAGIPGVWTPPYSTPPDNFADLDAGDPVTVVASPTSAWTTGQYVQTLVTGATGQAHWGGAAWLSGPA